MTDTKRRILFLHDPKLLDPGELEAVRDHTSWAVGESVLDVRAGDLVIARHTVWPWPRRVARDIARQGGELLNGTSAYVYADTPVSWSYDLGDLTPRTWTDFSRLPAAAAFIVKGAKADKSRWDRMFARNAYAARELMALVRDDRVDERGDRRRQDDNSEGRKELVQRPNRGSHRPR